MVSTSVIYAAYAMIIIVTVVPVVAFLALYLTARKKELGIWCSLGLGAVAPLWSSFLFPVLVLSLLNAVGLYSTSGGILTVIFIGIVYGMFNGVGKLWGIWLMNKRTPSLYRALCTGIGYSVWGIIMTVSRGLDDIKLFNILNSDGVQGLKDHLTAQKYSELYVDSKVASLVDAQGISYVLAGIDQVLIVIFEVALAVLIYEGIIRKKKWIGTLVAAGVYAFYKFVTELIIMMTGESFGNMLSEDMSSILCNVFLLICGLAGVWLIMGAFSRYQLVLKEGPYAHYAYFEKEKKHN